jgi:hypothetical protein
MNGQDFPRVHHMLTLEAIFKSTATITEAKALIACIIEFEEENWLS